MKDLDTPSLVIDIDIMERNIAAMQARCDALGVAFRPHIKTHKTPEIARMQIDAGAVGIACQKVTEAEVFADAGFTDIQIPYNIVGPQKTARLAALANRCQVSVSADDPAVIAGLAEASTAAKSQIHVLVDLGTDIQRTGTSPDRVVDLARQISAAPYLHFAGILVYPSQPVNRPALLETLARLNEAGFQAETISGGGTPASMHMSEFPELTEIRVGTYIFNDCTQMNYGSATLDDCALKVLATVVSHPVPERIILDCGSKTLSGDRLDGQYGMICEYPQARIYGLSEEHAHVDVSACDPRPPIGERVHVIPAHVCTSVNLADRLYGYRGEQIETVWNVAARGKVW
jgi:D-serine deaminase-like pyridoxal phosphate-dependent protein